MAQLNLLSQIFVDLIILTFVVYFIGSTETHIPFVYLFHIVLSSIFFTSGMSFLILDFSCLLFGACLVLERYGGFSTGGIFASMPYGGSSELPLRWVVLHYGSVLGIWAGVWYLAGHLADTVRKQDIQLAQANRRLEAALDERMRHMLWTTHALKSPFAAIAANTQLLLNGLCGTLPQQAVAVVERISQRCTRLSKEIQEMLQLANLESSSQQPAKSTVLNADDLLRTVIQQISPTAEKRSIRFVSDLEPVRVRGVHDHLMMLFENLISNAVNYSHPGGCVVVSAHQDNGCATISVIDEGIGIEAEKLPLVFEQYYRTKAAAAHNKESSGLGLAIVLQIVRLYGIRVCVHSAPNAGTRFDLYFETAA